MKKDIHLASSKDVPAIKSLRFSFLDGIFASATVGFTQDYFTPFLLLSGASTKLVGILNALQNISASFTHLVSPDLTARAKSRRKIINTFIFFQALVLLPLAVLASRCAVRPVFFIVLSVLFVVCGALASPAWQSLMSDLVSVERRGAYFGWRNKTLGFVTVGASFAAGLVLHAMKRVNVCYGFALIFFLAFIFRLSSWYFLTRMHEPALNHKREDQFTLFEFIGRLKESNFAKFVLFVAMMHFSVNLASPFFPVLMLEHLSFSYALYAFLTVTASFTVCLMMGRWGRCADMVGNLRVLKVTSPLIGLIPLLWIFNRHPVFLFFAQAFSGFAWAGFNLCATNFIYDAVTPEKRTRCIAYFHVFNGLALGLGSLLGGFLIPRLPLLFGDKILSLLLISALLRIAVAFCMPRLLREVRRVESVGYGRLFLNVAGIRPFSA